MRLYEITASVEVKREALERLRGNGFDTTEPLYHGTNSDFEQFRRQFNRTAADFYLTPDVETARYYGQHVYLCYGRQDPQANLIDDHKLVGQIAETFAEEFYDHVREDEALVALREKIAKGLSDQSADPDEDVDFYRWGAEEDDRYVALRHRLAVRFAIEYLQDGKMYEMDFKGFFQDSVMSECFGLGYRSVRFYDHSTTGDPVSVVFRSPEDVAIAGKLRS